MEFIAEPRDEPYGRVVVFVDVADNQPMAPARAETVRLSDPLRDGRRDG